MLKQHKAFMLLKKAQAVEDLKKLEHLKTKAESFKSSHSKKLYYKRSDANSSLNTQTVASNLVINISLSSALDGANLSVDLSCFSFLNFFLANFFSFEVVDPLALSNLSSRGGIP